MENTILKLFVLEIENFLFDILNYVNSQCNDLN